MTGMRGESEHARCSKGYSYLSRQHWGVRYDKEHWQGSAIARGGGGWVTRVIRVTRVARVTRIKHLLSSFSTTGRSASLKLRNAVAIGKKCFSKGKFKS